MARALKSTAHLAPILGIDIGGTALKAALLDDRGRMLSERLRVPTPDPCPPHRMVTTLLQLVRPLPLPQRIAIGFPGVVRGGKVLTAPHWKSRRWVNFPLAATLSKRLGGAPARLINDAEMQGLAVIKGHGLELVLTLGTGAGTALFHNGALTPHLELAHHPLHKRDTYNDYLGNTALREVGKKRWNRRVAYTVEVLYSLLHFDRLYVGGGNSRHVSIKLPHAAQLVSNDAGIEGGAALWRLPAPPV